MKKMSKYALSAVIALSVLSQNAFAVNMGDQSALCALLSNFSGVIGTIRTLAFVGAAFMIMEWAWNFIKDPDKEATKDKIKDKGIGLLLGFGLLLGVAFLLQFVSSAAGQESLGCIVEVFQ